jgi:hypothetical protein
MLYYIKMTTQLNLAQSQSLTIPQGLKHEFQIISSQSAPSWGSNFIIRLTEKAFIHQIVLAFNVNAVSGFTDSGTFGTTNQVPRFSPTYNWVQKIEIVQNDVLATLYPDALFLSQQLFEKEDDRVFSNASSGIYSNTTNRRNMSIANSTWYLPLKTVFDQSLLPILTESQAVEIRVWMNPLANLITTTGLTVSSLSANINSCNAIVKLTKLPPAELAKEIQAFHMKPKHYRYYESRYASATAQSGVSTFTMPLTNIVGKVSSIYFIIRRTDSMTLDNAFSYVDINSFALLDGSSTNICGGADINSLYNRSVQAKHWNRSFYLLDAFNGTSSAFVFQYSFSLSPFNSTNGGQAQTYMEFNGTQLLKINFSSALSATHDITLFAQTACYVEQSKNGVRRFYA